MNKKTISKPYKSLGDSNPNNLADDSEAKTNEKPQISRKRHDDNRRRHDSHRRWVDGLVRWGGSFRPMAVAKRARKSLGDPEGCETAEGQSRRFFGPQIFQFSGMGTGTVNALIVQG